ncbi:hypothetical protein GC175_24625 [bacterium]|nr:hypothetical protein [bacterium]
MLGREVCIDATRRKRQVAFVGESSADTPMRVSADMIRKGLTRIGSRHNNMADKLLNDSTSKHITHYGIQMSPSM